MKVLEPWLAAPLQQFLDESSARLVLLTTTSGQVVAQHGFVRAVDVMAAAALGAGIVASTEAMATMAGAGRFDALVHQGPSQSLALSAFETARGRWIGLVVFGPETTVGVVQLFFGDLVRAITDAMPAEPPVRGPVLAETFERELNTSLRNLFGR